MKSAIVFINLGTPAAPDSKGVRAFLKEFLWDPRVVEVPRPLWWLILHLVILPFRSPRVAGAYRQIWMQNISPLRFFSEELVNKVTGTLRERYPDQQIETSLAMTYGSPNIPGEIARLRQLGCERFLFIPLYPQYSATTTAAVHDQISRFFASCRDIPAWSWVRDYHDHPLYIDALAQSVLDHWQNNGRGEKLLVSFHGIPRRNVDLGDPYLGQCERTASLLADKLGLQEQQWQLSFQSRLGKAEWLQPYTDKTVIALAEGGVRHLDVMCPAFAAECLETLEEIDGEANELFRHHGGEQFNYIPCLNSSEPHQQLMLELCRVFLQDKLS